MWRVRRVSWPSQPTLQSAHMQLALSKPVTCFLTSYIEGNELTPLSKVTCKDFKAVQPLRAIWGYVSCPRTLHGGGWGWTCDLIGMTGKDDLLKKIFVHLVFVFQNPSKVCLIIWSEQTTEEKGLDMINQSFWKSGLQALNMTTVCLVMRPSLSIMLKSYCSHPLYWSSLFVVYWNDWRPLRRKLVGCKHIFIVW